MSAILSNSPTPPNALFVYGTLMRGESRHGALAAATVTAIRPASISGELFELGEYPGMRLSSRGTSRVRGELIELEALDTIIDQLDTEEGPEFKREVVNVTLDEGHSHFAWVYVLAADEDDFKSIPSGDWRAR